MLYGLGVEVDRPLAVLSGLPLAEQMDTRIWIGAEPAESWCRNQINEFYVSADLDEDGHPEFRASYFGDSGAIRFAYSDGTVFTIDALGSQVWAEMPPSMNPDELAPALMGPVMGIVLRLRGVTSLHASAVAIDGRAIALVGESGAGKSTTAAAFAHLGYPVLSDDVLALTDCGDHFLVRPAYPRIRLWPESAAGLFGSADALPIMMSGWDKRYLSLRQPGYRFQEEPLPLAAVYFLGPRGKSGETMAFETVSPAAALMTLISDSFATNFQDKPHRAAEFEQLSRLVSTLPLRRICAPNDLTRIDDLCAAIAEDVRLSCRAAEAL